jgi:fumarate hydratase class II
MGTALAPRIGYDNVAAVAKAAYREGKTIRDIALELVEMTLEEVQARLGTLASARSLTDKGGCPGREEIEQRLDPRTQTIRGSGATGERGG